MENEVGYKTLKEIHKAYADWETENKAWDFGWNLWETAKKSIPADPDNLTKEELANEVFERLYQEGSLTQCLTDDFRRLVIRYHARGYTTTKAIETILSDEAMAHITPFYLFRHNDVCGYENIKGFLVARTGYLKPPHPQWSDEKTRWPEKKYGELWQEERTKFIDEIKHIPLTHPLEQLTKLSEHYQELEMLFEKADDAKDQEILHKCMMRTLASIHLITRDPTVKAMPSELTQESRKPALQKPDDSDIIDIPTHDVSTHDMSTQKIEGK